PVVENSRRHEDPGGVEGRHRSAEKEIYSVQFNAMKTPFPCQHAVALVLAELFTLFGAAVSGVPQQNLAFSKFVFTQRVSIPQTGANLAGWKFSLWQGASKTKNHPRFLPSFAQCR